MSHDTHALLSRSTIGAALLVFTGAANVASQPVLLKPGSSAAYVELLSVVNDFGTAYSMSLGVTPHTMVEVGSSFGRQVYDRKETSNQELNILGIQPFVILNLVQPGDTSPISLSAEMAWQRDWFDSSDNSVLDDLTGKGWKIGSRFGGLVTSDRSRLHLEVGSGYGRYRTKLMDHAEGTSFLSTRLTFSYIQAAGRHIYARMTVSADEDAITLGTTLGVLLGSEHPDPKRVHFDVPGDPQRTPISGDRTFEPPTATPPIGQKRIASPRAVPVDLLDAIRSATDPFTDYAVENLQADIVGRLATVMGVPKDAVVSLRWGSFLVPPEHPRSGALTLVLTLITDGQSEQFTLLVLSDGSVISPE